MLAHLKREQVRHSAQISQLSTASFPSTESSGCYLVDLISCPAGHLDLRSVFDDNGCRGDGQIAAFEWVMKEQRLKVRVQTLSLSTCTRKTTYYTRYTWYEILWYLEFASKNWHTFHLCCTGANGFEWVMIEVQTPATRLLQDVNT